MNLDDNNKIIRQGLPEPTPRQQAEYYRMYDELVAAWNANPKANYHPKSRLIHVEVARRMHIESPPFNPTKE